MKDSIARKIRALQARTEANGCTEAEALNAIEKISELLDTYNIDLTEVEVREEGCFQFDFATSTKRKSLDHRSGICRAIARLTQCKQWRKALPGETIIRCFFGRKTDLEFAKFLYRTCMFAVDLELTCFKIDRKLEGEKTTAVQARAFTLGIADRLSARINELVESQVSKASTSGRDLIVVKIAYVLDEFAKLGVHLGQGISMHAHSDATSYAAGRSAGDTVGLGRPLSGAQRSGTLQIEGKRT